jgi:hypothetical protein
MNDYIPNQITNADSTTAYFDMLANYTVGDDDGAESFVMKVFS